MDKLIGGIIDDLALYSIIEILIIILILLSIYIGIQLLLTWKFLNKEETNSNEIISNKKSFYRIIIFIFISGFFMIIHEFLEGFDKNAADHTTYKFFEFMALLGLVLFMIEWHKILKKLKKKQKS